MYVHMKDSCYANIRASEDKDMVDRPEELRYIRATVKYR